jgi:hypothetical protein
MLTAAGMAVGFVFIGGRSSAFSASPSATFSWPAARSFLHRDHRHHRGKGASAARRGAQDRAAGHASRGRSALLTTTLLLVDQHGVATTVTGPRQPLIMGAVLGFGLGDRPSRAGRAGPQQADNLFSPPSQS